ncbi:hypothetical protein AG1IA_03086 [Rhizoctonia solani AG-1 IA]|uniref:Uncharacterized protein n=1 Tax=Thanatephorus cucumeris (strain AG1-IA) TaxID=983506 RepID=L8X2M2_THACA|nr:hypothetical protein AG1IA_03086 [Rhizoctonia solani AG-1 IA]
MFGHTSTRLSEPARVSERRTKFPSTFFKEKPYAAVSSISTQDIHACRGIQTIFYLRDGKSQIPVSTGDDGFGQSSAIVYDDSSPLRR